MDFLKAIVAAIIADHAAEMFGVDQAIHLVRAARTGLTIGLETARSLASFEPARLAAIVRPSLRVGISLRRRTNSLLQDVAEGLLQEMEGAAIAERLIGKTVPEFKFRMSLQTYAPCANAGDVVNQLSERCSDLGITPQLVLEEQKTETEQTSQLLLHGRILSSLRMIPPGTVLVKLRPEELPKEVGDACSWITPSGEDASIIPAHAETFLKDWGAPVRRREGAERRQHVAAQAFVEPS